MALMPFFNRKTIDTPPDIAAAALRSDRFRLEREGEWKRLEMIVSRMESGRIRRLSDEDVLALPALYRTAASSLAVARETTLDASTLAYLEGLVLRAWFGRMSRSDLFMIMVLIMATISGAILVLYATTLSKTVPNAVGHMIVASLISLPGAILVARLMVPGDGKPDSSPAEPDLHYESSMDAVIRGTMEGVTLVLAVIGIIITVFALVNLVDQVLALLPLVEGAPLTLRRMLGWLMSPAMWAIGVPWDQAPAAGSLMGTKAILNEYVAYLDLAALPAGTLDPRSLLIVTYALCGVANLASVGLIVSTVATLSPERRGEVAQLGMKSWLAGNMVSMMTGAVIGLVTWS